MWKKGPEILQQDESTWPPQIPNEKVQRNIVEGERRKVNVTHTTRDSSNQSIIDPNRFSSFQRLVRVTGWVRRFLSNCKRPNENREKSRTLRAQELQQAETYWFKRTQSEAFSDGVREKCLIQLNPKKDENGLLQSDGRLRNATDVPYGVRHPILLPKDHTVTRLIIISAHENLGHGSGVEHVLTELRARFWIIKGRRTVRNTIEKCPGCRRRFTGKPTTQMMAPLPMSRLQCPLRAFERVGVDYGGP